MSQSRDAVRNLDAALTQASLDNADLVARTAHLESMVARLESERDALRDVVQGLRARNTELEARVRPGLLRRVRSVFARAGR